MYMEDWFAGPIISVVFGGFSTWLFLKGLRRWLRIEHKPTVDYRRVPPWLTGAVERCFFTMLIGLEIQGVPTAMMAWLALKLATNWNHPEWKDRQEARTFAFSALLAGVVSMLFAALGGYIWVDRHPTI